MKRLAIVASAVLVLSAVLIAMLVYVIGSRPPTLNGTLLEPPIETPDFELLSADGAVRKSDYGGRLVVIFFGYTFCPDVCPMTMTRLRTAMELLGPEAHDVQVLMVSVDPERDTTERVSSYAKGFDPAFVGLTGTRDQITRVAADYGVFHAEAEGSAETGYLVDHTAAVMVLDREGNTRLIWSYEITPEEMADDLRYLIRRS